MSNLLTARAARIADAETIAAFNTAMAWDTEHKRLDADTVLRGVRTLFARPEHGFYIVAESRGDVIGSLMVTYEWSDWRCGLFWWIQSVYVRPEHRRRGVLREMIDFLKTKAAAATDVCGFRLYVEKGNHIAMSTYEKLGLHQVYYRVYEQEFPGEPTQNGASHD